MSYTDIYMSPKKNPPVIMMVLALIAVGGFFITLIGTKAPSTRASTQKVTYHTVANLSSRQAAIYFQTANQSESWIIYGTSQNSIDKIALDERDTEKSKTASYLHYIPLNDLQENTAYYYKIVTDQGVVSINNTDTFSFKTVSPFIASSSVQPAYGKVIAKNNELLNTGFVIYTYPNAYPLVTAIKGGDWLISLNSLINTSTGKSILPDINEKVKLEIIDDQLNITTIETALTNTTPFAKTVIVGTEYEVQTTETVLAANTQATSTPSPTIKITSTIAPTKVVSKTVPSTVPTKTPTLTPTLTHTPTPTKVPSPVEISFPKESSVIPGNKPLIKGLAVPGNQVSVALTGAKNQAVYSTKLTATSRGEWNVSLPMTLVAENYTLKILTLDSNKRQMTLTRKFSIAKSGEGVLGEATESGQLTPTVSVPTPTQVIAQNITSTPIAPTTTYYSSPTVPVSTPPVTGENNIFLMIGSVALVAIGVGALLIL